MTWSTAWEASTAVGTVAMAVTTVLVIRQNRRQHQDAFRPICVLVPDDGLNQSARLHILQKYEEPGKPDKFYNVRCSLRNIGVGPALQVRLIVRFSSRPGFEIKSELPPVGAKQAIESPLRIPVFLHDRFNSSDFEIAPGEVWELHLIYQDVFGNTFHTCHSKNPQVQWTTLGRS